MQKFKVIMITFNHHLPLLGKYSKNTPKWGENTPSQNLGLAGLHHSIKLQTLHQDTSLIEYVKDVAYTMYNNDNVVCRSMTIEARS
jgi:hypothetical protein